MKKNKLVKALSLCLVILMTLTLFAACSQQTEPSGSGETASAPADTADASLAASNAGGKTYKIGVHSYQESFESSQIILNGITSAAKNYNVELVFADINADPTKVPQNIENFLIQDVDAIIDATWFADVGATTVKTCEENGIILVTCDVPFDEEYSYLVGADNWQAGVVAGDYMTQYINDNWGGEIDYFVCFFPEIAGPDVKKRQEGAISQLAANGLDLPEDKVIWLDNGGDTLKAKTMATDFLTAHPDSHKIVFAANNDAGGVGTLAAVEAADRSADCVIYSYGGETSSVENFKTKDNCWIGSVSFSLDKYGEVALDTIMKLLNGDTDVPRTQSPELYMIDRTNVNDIG